MMAGEKQKEKIHGYFKILGIRAVKVGFEDTVEGTDDYISYRHGLLASQIRECENYAIQSWILHEHFLYSINKL